ncbi:MAG TPA: polyphosphate polymerase domain-containing protein [Lachnospiraceae bacterium]|jgi:SPX domain protein involved in polyphosphate accumulation|nr:polyphosphate polymerase domain-containing protein [Lachnospiraceae bacterium]
METVQHVFERYEKKYLLNRAQYENLLVFLKQYMKQDQYGLHTICNIYYDTASYDLIRHSLEKPIYKEKFRVRSYGRADKTRPVFLELKKKYKGVVYKRRVAMTFAEAEAYLLQNKSPKNPEQILREIDWFLNLNDVAPKIFIAYDRIALFCETNPNLRITFDHNIRFRDYDLDLSKGTYGRELIDKKMYLMELKIEHAVPLWLSNYLTKEQIYPTSFSKYGTCYKEYLFYKELSKNKGGIYCA